MHISGMYRGDGSYSKTQFVNNSMSVKTAAVADGAAVLLLLFGEVVPP